MMITNTIKKDDLLRRIDELENKLQETEQTLEAIKFDKIDAFVISTDSGEQIFTLQGADRPYRIFLEQMNEGAITVSNDGTILYCNKSFADILNFPLENLFGTCLTNLAELQDQNRLKSFINQTASVKEEISFLRSDGTSISLYLSLTRLNIEGIEPVVCIIATDLTEKKKNEEIVAAEKLARSILEQAGEAIVVCDEDMLIIRSNKAADLLAGEPVLYKIFDSVFPLYDKNKNKLPIKNLIEKRKSKPEEVTIIRDGDNKIHLIISIGKLNGHLDEVLGYVINLTNISKHVSIEERLSASLREKTVLLKEIHHRVKNNLQIVSSLLALQSASTKQDSVTNILGECRNRISSMALIHQKLYESTSFSSININDYIKELLHSLSGSYQLHSYRLNLDLPPEDIHLTIEAAIPLGLILNELVTNSFKHAFIKDGKGEIGISLKEMNNKGIELLVYDNGPGIPQNNDFYNPETLGLQLVQTLIKQINGDIDLMPGNGTRIRIEFPTG